MKIFYTIENGKVKMGVFVFEIGLTVPVNTPKS